MNKISDICECEDRCNESGYQHTNTPLQNSSKCNPSLESSPISPVYDPNIRSTTCNDEDKPTSKQQVETRKTCLLLYSVLQRVPIY